MNRLEIEKKILQHSQQRIAVSHFADLKTV